MNTSNRLEQYALIPPITEFSISHGIHTGAGDYVLKRYDAHHNLANLKYEHDLLAWLAQQPLSFSVPSPIKTITGHSVYQDPHGVHVLMPLLPGQRSDPEDPANIKAMGAALAELQATLCAYPTAPRPDGTSFDDLGNVHTRIPNPESLSPEDVGWPETSKTKALCT